MEYYYYWHNVFQIVNVCRSQVVEQVDLFPRISPQIEAMLTPRTSFSRRDSCSVLTSHLLLTSPGKPTKMYNNVYYGVHVYTPPLGKPTKMFNWTHEVVHQCWSVFISKMSATVETSIIKFFTPYGGSVGGFNTTSRVPYIAIPLSFDNTRKNLTGRNEIPKKSKIIAP